MASALSPHQLCRQSGECWRPTGAAIGPAGDFVGTLGQAIFAGSLVAAIVVLVVRVRRSAGVEREQLKWVIYAVSLLAVAGPATGGGDRGGQFRTSRRRSCVPGR